MVKLVVLDCENSAVGHRIVSSINISIVMSISRRQTRYLLVILSKGRRALLDLDVYALSTIRSGYHPSHNAHLVKTGLGFVVDPYFLGR